MSGTRPCSACGHPTKSKVRLCAEHKPSAPKRREVKCATCGTRTTARSGVCPRCPQDIDLDEPEDDVALTGGRWVLRNGIQVWQPNGPKTAVRGHLRALLDERYFTGRWFTTSPSGVPTEHTARGRREAMAADFNHHDRRADPQTRSHAA